MSFATTLDKLVEATVKIERGAADLPQPLHAFRVVRTAGDLVEPSRRRAEHHRAREKHYTTELERAEKELREKGVTIDVVEAGVSMGYAGGHLASGAIGSGAIGSLSAQFQPKINQDLLDAVKRAKNKMLDHRGKAEQFEKYHQAFVCQSNVKLELTVDEVHLFQLAENHPSLKAA